MSIILLLTSLTDKVLHSCGPLIAMTAWTISLLLERVILIILILQVG